MHGFVIIGVTSYLWLSWRGSIAFLLPFCKCTRKIFDIHILDSKSLHFNCLVLSPNSTKTSSHCNWRQVYHTFIDIMKKTFSTQAREAPRTSRFCALMQYLACVAPITRLTFWTIGRYLIHRTQLLKPSMGILVGWKYNSTIWSISNVCKLLCEARYVGFYSCTRIE